MAEKDPSEASNKKLAESRMIRVGALLGAIAHVDNWMPCARCGCGAIAHGYDEPYQRCLCGKCQGYRTRRDIQSGAQDGSYRL